MLTSWFWLRAWLRAWLSYSDCRWGLQSSGDLTTPGESDSRMLTHWQSVQIRVMRAQRLVTGRLYWDAYVFSWHSTWIPPKQELDHKEGWSLNNWCLWTVVLEKTLESPLDFREIKPVNHNGNWPWIFIGKTDAKAEALILLPISCEKQTHWKRPWCWERWRQEEKGTAEDEMVRWHHQLNRHEFEQTLGDGER